MTNEQPNYDFQFDWEAMIDMDLTLFSGSQLAAGEAADR
jgi:hypothetical protein